MFVCDGLQHGRIRRREDNIKEFNCIIVRSGIYETETTNNKRLRSTFCFEAIQTRSSAQPLCDSRATCFLNRSTFAKVMPKLSFDSSVQQYNTIRVQVRDLTIELHCM